MGSSIASDQLVSLVYVSSGVREYTDEEITGLLAQSRLNNERDGVTGMLLYRGGNFLQVLEGPDAAMQITLDRIKRDQRHRGIIVLKKNSIQRRLFSDWTLAFRRLGSGVSQALEGYSPFMEMSFDSRAFETQPDFSYRMLLQFKQKMR